MFRVGQRVVTSGPPRLPRALPRVALVLSTLCVLAVLLLLVNDPSATPSPSGGAKGVKVSQGRTPKHAVLENRTDAVLPGPDPGEDTRGLERNAEPPASLLIAQAEGSTIGLETSRGATCPNACSGRGTCNEERGECFCRASFGGEDCSLLQLPSCQLAANYSTPCSMVTTCECSQECQELRLPMNHLCFRGTGPNGQRLTNLTEIFSGPRYKVVLNPSPSTSSLPDYSAAPEDSAPSPWAPPQDCPNECGGRGVCVSDRHHCFCGWSSEGVGCERISERFPLRHCLNECSGKGQCLDGECQCEEGFFGMDCSLFLDDQRRTRILPRRPYSWTKALGPEGPNPTLRPKLYVYDLPPYFNTWQGFHSTGLDWLEHVWFLERALNSPHRTADPEEADFFYLPLFLRNRDLHYETLVTFALDYVKKEYPKYFARRNGSDHIVLTNMDWGNCQLDGPSGRGILARALDPILTLTLWGHTKNMGMEDDRPCFRRGWDIVIPPVMAEEWYNHFPHFPFQPSPEEQEKQNRTILLYFKGSSYKEDKGASSGKGFQLSLGARQALFTHFEGRFESTGVLLENMPTQSSFLDVMHRAQFCYAPAGFGWAMRTTQACLMGCIPVIVQPNVVQPFQGDGLRWEDFAVLLPLEDVPRIDEILRAIPLEEQQRKREACFRIRLRFVWSSFTLNPLHFLPQKEQDEGARLLVDNDAFMGVMEALRLRLDR